jgi:hypothetical protein
MSWIGSEKTRAEQGAVAQVATAPAPFRIRTSSPIFYRQIGTKPWIPQTTWRTAEFEEAETWGTDHMIFTDTQREYLIPKQYIDFH